MSDTDNMDWQDLRQLVSSTPAQEQGQNFMARNFSLPNNPFSPNGIADESGTGKPLRVDTAKSIRNFITEGYRTGKTQFLVIRGDYGTGKTHILRFIEHVVNIYMSTGDRAARAIYVERPRIEAHELNRTILRSLGDDTIRKYVWFVIQNELIKDISSKNHSDEYRSIRKKLNSPLTSRRRGIPANPTSNSLFGEGFELPAVDELFSSESIRDHRTFLSNLEKAGGSRELIRHYLTTLLIKAVEKNHSSELASAFVALLLAPDEMSFASWESLLAAKGVYSSSPLRTPDFLQFLLQIMSINGTAYVFLLLDEFEEVSQGSLLSPRQRQDYLYTTREVFDKIQQGISIIMAISPPGWDALQQIATPLYDRAPQILSLDRLTIEDAVGLVKFYFEQSRHTIDAKDLGFTEPDDPLFPFTQKFIEVMVNNFPPSIQRTPRNFIQFCHRLLDYCMDNNIISITEDVGLQVLQQFSVDKAPSTPRGRGKRNND